MIRKTNTTYKNGSKQAQIYRDTDNKEWIVRCYINGKHKKQYEYFTDSKTDAHNTAQTMVGLLDAWGNKRFSKAS